MCRGSGFLGRGELVSVKMKRILRKGEIYRVPLEK
jgi:hypothetical protein